MESQSPSVVLAAYAEPLLDGRRVVVLGDATSRVADELTVRGARSVLVLDPIPSRAALGAAQNRTKQITILPLDDADIAVKDGVFDVAIVTDLSALNSPETVLAQVRKALAPRGTAIVATPNPDVRIGLLPRADREGPPSTLGYYELYDLVAAEFAEVRMLGQTPFVGYAVVDFAPEGEPSVALDSGLLPGGAEEPEWFVAIAGREPAELDELSIVQLPLSRVLLGDRSGRNAPPEPRADRAADARRGERILELQAALDEKQAALEEKQTASDDARTEIARLTSDLRVQKERAEQALGEAGALRQQSAASDERARQALAEVGILRKQSAAGDERARQALAEAATLRQQSAANDERLRVVSAEVNTLRERTTSESERAETTRSETTTLRDRMKAGEAALAKARTESESTKAESEKRETAIRTLEARLKTLSTDRDSLAEKLIAAEGTRGELMAELQSKARSLAEVAKDSAGNMPDDLARLEAALGERAGYIRTLEGQLRDAERVGKGLVRELSAQKAPANGKTAAGPAPLAAENARLRADLEALGWTVEELERRLSGRPQSEGVEAPR